MFTTGDRIIYSFIFLDSPKSLCKTHERQKSEETSFTKERKKERRNERVAYVRICEPPSLTTRRNMAIEISQVLSSRKLDYDLKDLLPIFDSVPAAPYCLLFSSASVHVREKVAWYPRDLFAKLQRTTIRQGNRSVA